MQLDAELAKRNSQVVIGSSPLLGSALPAPLGVAEVPEFLARYGYKILGASQWLESAPLPRLSLQVMYTSRVDGHTWYHCACVLSKPDSYAPQLAWRVLRRLSQLRAGLHDHVKQALGAKYREYFRGVPFVSRFLADTERLNCWLRRLTESINAQRLPPESLAQLLQVLGAPAAEVATATELSSGLAETSFTELATAPREDAKMLECNSESPQNIGATCIAGSAEQPSTDEKVVEVSDGPVASVQATTHLEMLCSQGAVELVLGEEVDRIGLAFSQLPPAECLKVQKIRDDSPAALRGLSVGSKLLALNGRAVAELAAEDFTDMMRSTRPLVLLFLQCSTDVGYPHMSSKGPRLTFPKTLSDGYKDASDDGMGSEEEPECEEVESHRRYEHRGSF